MRWEIPAKASGAPLSAWQWWAVAAACFLPCKPLLRSISAPLNEVFWGCEKG